MKFSKYNHLISEDGVLFNAFTRSVVRLDTNETRAVTTGVVSTDIEANSDWERCGLIVGDDRFEPTQVKFLFERNYFSSESICLSLVPTFACNLAYPYCFEKGHTDAYSKHPRYVNSVRECIAQLLEQGKKVSIALFGGEPLLARNDILRILCGFENAAAHGMLKTSITTNGTLLDAGIVEDLARKYALSFMQVTIDGDRSSHNTLRVGRDGVPTFDTILRNFKRSIELAGDMHTNIDFFLRINVSADHNCLMDELAEIFDLNNRKRITILARDVFSTQTFETDNDDRRVVRLLEEAVRLGFSIPTYSYHLQHCEAGGGSNFFHVLPDLSLWKCSNDLSFTKAKVGELRTDGSIALNALSEAEWHDFCYPFDDESCKSCDILPICFGGCPLFKAKNGVRKCASKERLLIPYRFQVK